MHACVFEENDVCYGNVFEFQIDLFQVSIVLPLYHFQLAFVYSRCDELS